VPELRRPQRTLLIVIASAFVALGVILGLVYLRLWTRASEDLARLLPDTTRAWVSSPPPWVGVIQALRLDRWVDRGAIEAGLLRTGYLASGRTGEIAGLPVDLAREMLRGMDAVEIALVPAAGGVTAMVFVELRDVALRKRVVGRLQALTETVSRHVGFRIDAIHQSPWQRFTGIDPEPPRVVVMDPWIVFAWGEAQGVEDLLDARVGGRRDAIRKREGFLERGDRREVRAVIDAASLWLLAWAAAEPDRLPPPVPDDGLVEFLGLLTFMGRIEGPDDVAEVVAEIADHELAARLRAAVAPRPHELLGLLPADTLIAASVTSDDFARLAGVATELARRLERDLAGTGELPALVAALLDALGALGAPGGEVAVALLPGAEAGAPTTWVGLLRPTTGDAATLEATLSGVVPERFGDTYAHGVALVDDVVIHAEVPLSSMDPARSPPLVWRMRAGLLELGPDRATLERLAIARASERTLGRSGALALARRSLPAEPAAELVIDPTLLSGIDTPLLGLAARRLDPRFRMIVALTLDGDAVRLETNLGAWTIATAIASAPRDEIESFALPGLPPACRAAHFAMCRLYPDAVPCRPFSIGRRARILAACEALQRGGHIEP